MSGGFIAILGLEAVVFAAWGFHAFRCLFKLLGRAVAETGHPLPGIRVGLHMFRIFATAPEYARDRRILLLLTLALFVLIGAVVALAPGAGPR